jgi:hypothetical protein
MRARRTITWCEIDRGRDFFEWTERVDWIITNPPWSQFRRFLEHALEISEHVCFLATVNHWWTKRRVAAVRRARFGYRHLLLVDQPAEFNDTGFQLGAMHIEKGYAGPLSVQYLDSSEN